jgi:predicted alpha/beta-hydrolase family hydrolase
MARSRLMTEPLTIPTPRGATLHALLDLPQRPNGTAVVLAPGQAYPKELPILRRPAEVLAEWGVMALRFDWAYFTAGKSPSDGLRDEIEDLRSAVEYVRKAPGVKKVVVAGKSLGGHAALRLALLDPSLAGAALLTFSMHDPGEPDKPRPGVDLVTRCWIPLLVVNGDADPLADVDRL